MFQIEILSNLIFGSIFSYLFDGCQEAWALEMIDWELPFSATVFLAHPKGLRTQSRLSDAELVESFKKTRDMALIEILVNRYQAAILSVSYQFTTRTFTPADVQQELLILLVKKLPDLQVRSSLKAWLCTTLRNWLIDRRRQEGSHENYCAYQKIHGTFAEKSCEDLLDIKALFSEAMSLLRQEEANCVRLHYLEGKSYQEIADELNWSFKKVTGHMYRAIKRLRAKMNTQSLADCLYT